MQRGKKHDSLQERNSDRGLLLSSPHALHDSIITGILKLESKNLVNYHKKINVDVDDS